MMLQSEQINEIAAAMVKVQAAIRPALKANNNPFFKSKYADLGEVADACKDALHDNGVAVIQGARPVDGKPYMETKLIHTSGQWLSSLWELVPLKPDPQAMGSAITYMRRYSLAAMVGVLTEDDDGNAATHGGKPDKPAEKPASKPKADTKPKMDPSLWVEQAKDKLGPLTFEDRQVWVQSNLAALSKLAKEHPDLHASLERYINGKADNTLLGAA